MLKGQPFNNKEETKMELGIIVGIILVLGFGAFLYKKSKEDKKKRMDPGTVYFKQKDENADDEGQKIISTVGTKEQVTGSNPNIHPEYRKDRN